MAARTKSPAKALECAPDAAPNRSGGEAMRPLCSTDSGAPRAHLAGVDGRRREAKRWRAIFVDLLTRTNGKHEIVVRNLATLICQREALDAAIARGVLVEPLAVIRTVNAINRTMRLLGLAPVLEDQAPDATADALAAMRARTSQGAAA